MKRVTPNSIVENYFYILKIYFKNRVVDESQLCIKPKNKVLDESKL